MIIGVPRETFPGENRVALVPGTLNLLTKKGWEIWIEAGAGANAGFPDAEYTDKGARVVPSREEIFQKADVICQVRGLGANPDAGKSDLPLLRQGQIVVAMQEPLTATGEMSALAKTGATVFALELIPRITRAQSMDVLSSMATIAGYKAVLLAADTLPRMFPMMMTAAGTVAPAHAFIIGAGVAGLQAIASAKRMGARVQAYDIRPAVKEQIESLGGKFVEMELEAGAAETKGGYAREMDEEFYRKQRELMAKVVAHSDVVITTAAVPGKKAPILITGEMLQHMAPGSVVVDLAAERGGNCDVTRPGERYDYHGVTVLGPLNLPATVPYHASQMYGRNVINFLVNMSDKENRLVVDKDEITAETLVCKGGEVAHARVRETLGLAPVAVSERSQG